LGTTSPGNDEGDARLAAAKTNLALMVLLLGGGMIAVAHDIAHSC